MTQLAQNYYRAAALILSVLACTRPLPCSAIGSEPARVLKAYALTSAQNFANSDPRSWRVLGSNDDGHTWTVLDIQTNQIFVTRSERREFTVSNSVAFSTFRLEFGGSTDVSVAEVEFLGPVVGVGNEADLHGVVTASGQHPLLGSATQAFDGDPSTKWVDVGPRGSTNRWLQYHYTVRNEVEVSSLSELLIVARQRATRNRLLDKAPALLSTLTTRTNPVIRAIAAYALTSANDSPSRDPRDWRLLGSNDKGKNWITIDQRRNESFPRRFQKRTFTLKEPVAFAQYRLEIDSIRSPGAIDADSVQLAQIDPIFSGGPNTNKFCVVVSAHGENPPMEVAEKLFDGNSQSKWLDFGEAGPQNQRVPKENRSSWVQWEYLPDPGVPVINLKWLQNVRTHEPEPVHLEIQGLVVSWNPRTQIIGVLDRTVFQQLKLNYANATFCPGDQIRLAGQVQFEGPVPNLDAPTIKKLGRVPDEPDPLKSGEEEFFSTSVTGELMTIADDGACLNLRIRVDNDTRPVLVKVVPSPEKPRIPFAPGTVIKVRGLLQRLYNEAGVRAATCIWVPGLEYVTGETALQRNEKPVAASNPIPHHASDAGTMEIGNIYDLVRSQPNKSHAVRVRGIITYIDLGLNTFYLQDESDGIVVNGLFVAGLAPFLQQEGLYVEIEGETSTDDVSLNCTGPAKIIGRGRMPESLRRNWDYLMTGKDFNKMVAVEGVVREVREHRLVLIVGGGKLTAWINALDTATAGGLLGSVVRVCGVCTPIVNNRNIRLGVRLLAPSMEQVEVLNPVPKDPFSLPLQPMAKLLNWGNDRGTSSQLVKTAGVVTYQEPRLLFVQDGDIGVRVSLRQDSSFQPGDRVEIVGFAEPDGLSAKLVQALARRTGTANLPIASPIDLLNTDSSASDGTRAQTEARLLGIGVVGPHTLLELRDEKREIAFTAVFPTNHGSLPSLPVGSRVRLTGVFKAELDELPDFGQEITSFQVFFNSPEDVTVLERPSWWTTRHTIWVAALLGTVLVLALAWVGLLRRRVSLRTRELSAEIEERKRAEKALQVSQAHLQIQIDSMPIACITWSTELRVLSWNPAAEKIFGYSASEIIGQRPYNFIVSKDEQLEVESVWRRLLACESSFHTVYENTSKDGRKIQCEWTSTPLRGTEGRIEGVLSMVQDVTARKEAESELAYERDLLKSLLENVPISIYFKDRDSRFVRYSKSLSNLFPGGSVDSLRGKTDFKLFTEEHARAAFEDEQTIIRTGIPVVGKIERETHLDGHVTWALTSKLPWRDKDGNIIGTLGVSQNITPIKEAEAKLEDAHKQLVTISRQAGMAEVATSVLHNVGNVLNSVNVSGSLIANKLKHSKAGSLTKLVSLLQQNADHLAEFLTHDEKGRQIPSYLAQLSQFLISEQENVLAELQKLTAHIGHIKEIVALQQSFAKVSGVAEPVLVSDLVNDAVSINADALTRHKVHLIRQCDESLPKLVLDRHKVIQILVNLLTNATHACDESGKLEKEIVLRAYNGGGRVKIAVSDNGVGIPHENLSRIFTLGFTTRKTGHGFGLHSGAVAAQELGGTLLVQSEGPGKGSTFILELPAGN